MTHPLDLRFRGARDYLHGTDLFNAMVALTNAEKNICLRNYKPMIAPVEALRYDAVDKADLCALFEADCAGGRETWAVRESPDLGPPGRFDYDEAAVTADAVFDGNTASLPGGGSYSPIERIVALNKALLEHVLDGSKNWWFSRIDLDQVPDAAAPIRLVAHTASSRRLIKSDLQIDGRDAGAVYFSERTV